jgi:hypothetical protein
VLSEQLEIALAWHFPVLTSGHGRWARLRRGKHLEADDGVVTTAAYANGVLTLTNGSATIAALHLAGNYAGEKFSVSALGGGETQIELLPPRVVQVASRDFDASGTSDILFGQSSGLVATWLVTAASIAGGGTIGNPGRTWSVVGTGDFNDDGRGDLLFQDSSHNLAIWELGATQIIGGGNVGSPGGTWSIAGEGDFNTDGYSDILFQDSLHTRHTSRVQGFAPTGTRRTCIAGSRNQGKPHSRSMTSIDVVSRSNQWRIPRARRTTVLSGGLKSPVAPTAQLPSRTTRPHPIPARVSTDPAL